MALQCCVMLVPAPANLPLLSCSHENPLSSGACVLKMQGWQSALLNRLHSGLVVLVAGEAEPYSNLAQGVHAVV